MGLTVRIEDVQKDALKQHLLDEKEVGMPPRQTPVSPNTEQQAQNGLCIPK